MCWIFLEGLEIFFRRFVLAPLKTPDEIRDPDHVKNQRYRENDNRRRLASVITLPLRPTT